MLKWKDEYSKPVEKDLRNYFYQLFWKEIIEAIKDPYFLMNSNSALISAIRKGIVQYSNGRFTGEFSMNVSTELDKFAKYDGRTKTWKGFPPPSVSAVASVANNKAKALNSKILSLIENIPYRVDETVQNLKYSIDRPLAEMNEQTTKYLKSIGVQLDLTPVLSRDIADNYTNNLNLSIKDWSTDQTGRLRAMIEKNIISGYNRRELIDMVSFEYGVSMNKAKFLARQETTLLTSTVRDSRYQDAGIIKYMWMATGGKTGDGRTRDFHKKLHGQTFYYSSPPIIDERTGQRGNPGQAYGCRCTAKALL